ncbi:MAG: YgiQ family radical SAM protein [Fibrobacterota bacterium]|nr:YgiQ family radical SAM protein [Fibrobacterota bacterium]QQS07360.1 MAG: YgiQ family radical SAM protein [Fibrobacterota bacterium]
MFLPATREEMNQLGWSELDVILVTGDTYIDSPYHGAAVVGKVLAKAGWRVGIVSQPRTDTVEDISRLGEPRLFWGISAGCVDSMVANYTSSGKRRHQDDFTAGGENTRRPDRASIAYTGLVRRAFKGTRPIVLGGIEASLRRVAHYDWWDDKIRRSLLFDAKADLLVYGMGEWTSLEIARRLDQGETLLDLRGTCHLAKEKPEDAEEIVSFDEVQTDRERYVEMFRQFYRHSDPVSGKRIAQRHGERWLVQNAPVHNLSTQEMDQFSDLQWELETHPSEAHLGPVKAWETVRFSVMTHRGCYGECNFCAIAVHQGRTIQSRSEESVVREVARMREHPKFKGILSDAGGPTANMYGYECGKKLAKGACEHKRCVCPQTCKTLPVTHEPHLKLLRKLRALPGIRKVFVASGIRTDLLMDDARHGQAYLEEIAAHHVSGQLKVAPEHFDERILGLMGKPGLNSILDFKERFEKASAKAGKKQFLTYYVIAAHPGCSREDMAAMGNFARGKFGLTPEQVQIFTPTPGTWSTVMYATGIDPFTGAKVFVERDTLRRRAQKDAVALPYASRSTNPPMGAPRRPAR